MAHASNRSLLMNVHTKENISLLSTEAQSPNYRGFLNLGAIILIVANFRLIVENVMKYGFLLQNPAEFASDYLSLPCIISWLGNIFPCCFAYLLEARLAYKIPQYSTRIIQFFIQCYLLITPLWVISYYKVHFIPAFFLLSYHLIVSLKIYSFGSIMYEARDAYITKEYLNYPAEIKEVIAKYPNFTNITHFCYFLFYPTLCFQFHYPRSERIRKTWLFKRTCEWIIANSLMLILIQQYLTPLVKNTIKVLEEENLNYVSLLERQLKLSLPFLYLWLIFFYAVFQCQLNVLSEITRFADREFYREWWNSRTLGEYWKTWNIPVHSWMLRHVYFPMVNKKYGKTFSLFVTFLLSAVAHEYMISGACRILTYWAFMALMFQIPMIVIGDIFRKQLEKSQIGNVIFWVSFCMIGQPIAVTIYAYQAYLSFKS